MSRSFVRLVTQFRRGGDEGLVAEYELRSFRLADLRAMFDYGDDENLVGGCYPIERIHRAYFERVIGQRMDFRRYAYFLEVCALPRRSGSDALTR